MFSGPDLFSPRHDSVLKFLIIVYNTKRLIELSVAWPNGVQLVFFFCSGVSNLLGAQGSPVDCDYSSILTSDAPKDRRVY